MEKMSQAELIERWGNLCEWMYLNNPLKYQSQYDIFTENIDDNLKELKKLKFEIIAMLRKINRRPKAGSNNLRHYIDLSGISVQALADKLGCTRVTVYNYIEGESSPSLATRKLIIDILSAPYDTPLIEEEIWPRQES